MKLSELIMSIQQLAPQLASTCCVVNGVFMTLEEVEKMGYDEFSYRSKINMPLKLGEKKPKGEGGRFTEERLQAIWAGTITIALTFTWDRKSCDGNGRNS